MCETEGRGGRRIWEIRGLLPSLDPLPPFVIAERGADVDGRAGDVVIATKDIRRICRFENWTDGRAVGRSVGTRKGCGWGEDQPGKNENNLCEAGFPKKMNN